MKYYRLLWLKYDLPAGISVFFVALPLCLGIALASEAPLYSGILSGIIGGVVVSLISGSQLSVSGPAAGLTTLVISAIFTLGNFELFLLSVAIAGLFQLFLGIFKLGSLAYYFPSSVIKGMLAAIGIILILKQIPIALGYDKPNFWENGMLNIFESKNFIGNVIDLNKQFTRGTILISIASLVILIIFNSKILKKFKVIPSSLIVVVFGIIINIILVNITSNYFNNYSLKQTQLVNISPDIFNQIQLPSFSRIFENKMIWKYGIMIGLLATLETLLCVEAIDKLDKRNRITPANRELVAQGIGNMLCGILGAIPITAVVVRGAANVDAGARSKMAAFTHGLLLLLSVLFLTFFINKIPFASLSSILIITGYNLSKPKLFYNMWSLGLKQFLPFIITIIGVLTTDLLIGVSIGLLISIYYIVRNNFKAEYEISNANIDGEYFECIKLNTNVTFLNKVNLRKILDKVPENSSFAIDGSNSKFIDYDILEIISEFENKAKYKNIKLKLIGIEKVNINAIH
ncbi:MAG: SulP family inorganic anion transporter [Bacteroidetes bacterium]|nr:SulP family inorganic anion transporter [Bacteroidota bacterium]